MGARPACDGSAHGPAAARMGSAERESVLLRSMQAPFLTRGDVVILWQSERQSEKYSTVEQGVKKVVVSVAVLIVAVALSVSLFVALRIFSAHFSFQAERDGLLQELEQLRMEVQTKDAEIKRLQSCVSSSSAYMKKISEQNAVYKRMLQVMKCGSDSGSHIDRSLQAVES